MADQIVRTAVNTSVPVSIIELPDSKFNLNERNPFITHARLKIFYVGQTDDGRLFTEDFSNKLIKTLPQSPVVAYFDEESEDFKAHNQKQYVYGYVPENATIYFEEEDDRVWAFTDVVLFTGRNDNIGEVAKRIMGMQHSLELDPATVQYKVNKDGNGKFRNIEFTEGKFIGLSVVGKTEKPAFSGSHFFTIEEESEMAEALIQFQESIVSYFGCDTKDSNGISLCVFRNLDDIDLKPTQTMANNAKRGLDLRKEFGRGGTEVGVARARDLMNRKNLSPRTVQRMFSYFSRHEVDKQGQGWNSNEDGYPSAGLIAWLLWGGDAGFAWAESKNNQIKRARESQGSLIDRDDFSIDLDPEIVSNMDEARPAPKKDQIEGSDENKPGSAAGPGGDIKLSEAVETSLRNKLKEHNDKMKEDDKPSHTRTTYGQLAAVYRRGAGAYSTSYRPGKTRGQWAMARVNAYLYLLRNGRPENPKYITDYDLLPKDHPKSTRGNATSANMATSPSGLNQKQGGVEMGKKIIKKITQHAEHDEEEVTKMAWSCDGMQHENCQEQEDGSFMCDGMPHANCEKVEDMDKHYDEEDMGKHDDEEDMNKHDDEEKMSGHDDEEDMGKHDEEDMNKHDDEEDMDMHDDEEEEEEMKKFMRSPIDEIEANVMKQFRKAIGDNMQIVQWSMFDDMIAFYNGNDGKYYRVDFVMNDETETLTFGKPVIVMKRYLTEQEINQLFPEQQDRGGQVQNATKSIANGKNTPKQKGVLLTESQAKQFKKDMAELQVFRKADKLKLAATFQELVDKEIYNSILESIDSLTKEQLETKLSVEAMKRIKAEKESQKTQTINPVKFYTGATNTHTNQNPVASLIDQWKDKK